MVGVHNRLKASRILTTPDWIMLCHTSLLNASSFCIKIWECFFSVSRSECQGHGNIEWDTKRTSHHRLLSKSCNFSIWRKLVLRRSCQTAEWDAGESWSAVRLSCLSDYPTCQTIGSNCPSGLGLFGAGHLSRERLMQGQLTGGSGAAKFGWTIKLETRPLEEEKHLRPATGGNRQHIIMHQLEYQSQISQLWSADKADFHSQFCGNKKGKDFEYCCCLPYLSGQQLGKAFHRLQPIWEESLYKTDSATARSIVADKTTARALQAMW